MKLTNFFAATALLITSSMSFATGQSDNLAFDQDSLRFIGTCVREGFPPTADFSEEGLDIFYEDLIAGNGVFQSKGCLMKIKINVPDGWFPRIYSEAAVAGARRGDTLITLRHSVAGTITESVSDASDSPDADTFLLIKGNHELIHGYSCGKDITLKTTVTVYALDDAPSTFVGLEESALNGKTKVGFKLKFFPC